ncbi:unnamed protein product, partial [Owenia fusiformis]
MTITIDLQDGIFIEDHVTLAAGAPMEFEHEFQTDIAPISIPIVGLAVSLAEELVFKTVANILLYNELDLNVDKLIVNTSESFTIMYTNVTGFNILFTTPEADIEFPAVNVFNRSTQSSVSTFLPNEGIYFLPSFVDNNDTRSSASLIKPIVVQNPLIDISINESIDGVLISQEQSVVLTLTHNNEVNLPTNVSCVLDTGAGIQDETSVFSLEPFHVLIIDYEETGSYMLNVNCSNLVSSALVDIEIVIEDLTIESFNVTMMTPDDVTFHVEDQKTLVEFQLMIDGVECLMVPPEAEYFWTYGDETATDTNMTECKHVHKYDKKGTYTAELTIKLDGQLRVFSFDIKVGILNISTDVAEGVMGVDDLTLKVIGFEGDLSITIEAMNVNDPTVTSKDELSAIAVDQTAVLLYIFSIPGELSVNFTVANDTHIESTQLLSTIMMYAPCPDYEINYLGPELTITPATVEVEVSRIHPYHPDDALFFMDYGDGNPSMPVTIETFESTLLSHDFVFDGTANLQLRCTSPHGNTESYLNIDFIEDMTELTMIPLGETVPTVVILGSNVEYICSVASGRGVTFSLSIGSHEVKHLPGNPRQALFNHTFVTVGLSTVICNATDFYGKTLSYTQQVQVMKNLILDVEMFHIDGPETVTFDYVMREASAEFVISIDGFGSVIPEGVLVAWEFGDDSIGVPMNNLTSYSEMHSFFDAGTFIVTALIHLPLGESFTLSHTITVVKPCLCPIISFDESVIQRDSPLTVIKSRSAGITLGVTQRCDGQAFKPKYSWHLSQLELGVYESSPIVSSLFTIPKKTLNDGLFIVTTSVELTGNLSCNLSAYMHLKVVKTPLDCKIFGGETVAVGVSNNLILRSETIDPDLPISTDYSGMTYSWTCTKIPVDPDNIEEIPVEQDGDECFPDSPNPTDREVIHTEAKTAGFWYINNLKVQKDERSCSAVQSVRVDDGNTPQSVI